MSPTEIELLFRRFDKNRDCRITLNEVMFIFIYISLPMNLFQNQSKFNKKIFIFVLKKVFKHSSFCFTLQLY
jgi:Ca2+-binding EF-hand superfamily protein